MGVGVVGGGGCAQGVLVSLVTQLSSACVHLPRSGEGVRGGRHRTMGDAGGPYCWQTWAVVVLRVTGQTCGWVMGGKHAAYMLTLIVESKGRIRG